ncbi:hypothetical protein HA402_004763 [Bradysia odoriphaga]|nr:hypothetical protein HA402_004763 [Bradysia odoriphaga]
MIQRAFQPAEIPVRMDRLRVSTEEEEPITVLQDMAIDNSFDNIPLNYLSPSASPSPDEMIIRQRGRRSASILWSPEKIRDSLTPIRSAMTLRSSPRKRLLITDITPISPDQSHASVPRKSNTSQTKQSLPGGKRLKFDEKPIAQTNIDVPLAETLKGYSHDQLIAIIGGLVKEQPELEVKIRSELPIPDIRQMEEQLSYANKNIYKSLPTSRLAKKTDSISYARAATHLNAFKKTITDHTNTLNTSKNWDALLDYTQMAWTYVKATPIWDNHSHNTCRRNCFKILANHMYASLKHGGILLGENRIYELSNRIWNMSEDCNDSQINLNIELLNNIIATIE